MTILATYLRQGMLTAILLAGLAAPSIAADAPTRIAFVDTGNTGRSVTAEALALALIAEKTLPVQVISRAVDLNPYNVSPEPNAAALLARRGIDVSAHRAVQVSANDIRHSDLVLVMTAKHKATLLEMFPDAKGKTFTLTEYATGEERDVVDAYGQPMAFYEDTFGQIDSLIPPALDKAIKR